MHAGRRPGPADTANKDVLGNYRHAPVVEVNEVMILSVFKVIQQVGASGGQLKAIYAGPHNKKYPT